MGKGIAAIAAGIGFISAATVGLYYATMGSLGLIWGGCESIIQSRKK